MSIIRKFLLPAMCLALLTSANAQKPESIHFHLYTDSLKKGFFNYINVDGKTSDGNWLPLTSKDIILKANTGRFEGNDLFIDSNYTADSVKVRAELKSNPAIWKEVVIYIRKRGFTEELKTDEEILGEMKKTKVKTKVKTKN